MNSIRRTIIASSAALAISAIGSPMAAAQSVEPEPQVIAAGEGVTSVGENGFITWIKVGSVSSGASQLYMGVGTVPPGSGTPRHLHEVDEEILYILDGEITLVLGDETHTVKTGGTAFIPPGTWMQVTNNSGKPARVLGVLGRGEVERCFRALYPAKGAYATEEERSKDFAFCKTRLGEQGNQQHH